MKKKTMIMANYQIYDLWDNSKKLKASWEGIPDDVIREGLVVVLQHLERTEKTMRLWDELNGNWRFNAPNALALTQLEDQLKQILPIFSQTVQQLASFPRDKLEQSLRQAFDYTQISSRLLEFVQMEEQAFQAKISAPALDAQRSSSPSRRP